MSNACGDVLGDLAFGATSITCHCSMPSLFLLASDGFRRALAGTGIGVGTLTANRKVAAVAQTTIGAKVHKALDVHLNFATQVTFDGVVAIDVLTQGQCFGVAEFVDPAGGVDASCFADGLGRRMANSGDICEGDWNPFGSG